MEKPYKYTIGIVGFGFVGKAIHHGFAQWANFRINDVDPKLSTHTIEEVTQESDFIFICVPTPMNLETNQADWSIIDGVIANIARYLKGCDNNPIIIIKSTAVPGTVRKYQERYSTMRLIFNPEFLTERSFKLDFINQSRIILGGHKEDTEAVAKLYETRFPGTPIFHTSSDGAEFVKYICNNFFSVKVSYFNEVAQVCEKLGLDYNEMVPMILTDGRIGNSHWQVPGHDGSHGFGGKCVVGQETAIVCDEANEVSIESFESLYNKCRDGRQYQMLSMSLQDNEIAFKPIEGVRCREVSEIIEVKTNKGYRLEVTPDHKMIVFKDGRWIKKEAQELDLSDQIFLSSEIPYKVENIQIDLLNTCKGIKMVKLLNPPCDDTVYQAYREGVLTKDQKYRLSRETTTLVPFKFYLKYQGQLPQATHIQTGTRSTGLYSRYVSIDEDWARLIGYYLAEGSITGTRTYFSFNCLEHEYIQEVKDILTRKGFVWNEKVQLWKGKNSCTIIWVNHSILAFLFKDVWKCGENCYTKQMPSIIQLTPSLSQKCLEAFIKGDGSINGAGCQNQYVTINLATSSRILSEQLGWILRSYGILPSYTRKNNKKSNHSSYQWDISRKDDIEELLKHVDLTLKEEQQIQDKITKIKSIKAQKFTSHLRGWLVKVHSIVRKEQVTKVYSTQVKDHENFFTSGGMLVSNCFPKDINAMIERCKELGVDPVMLEAAWKKNLEVRKNHDWESIKGAVSNKKKEK